MAELLDNLRSLYPELAKEWNYEKNGRLTPDNTVAYSGLIVSWVCPEGHEFEEAVFTRSKGSGCPVCIRHRKSLAFRCPELAAEWDSEKNGELTDDVTASSSRRVWWKCAAGHEWQTAINSRSYRHSGCPTCSKMRRSRGYK